ncbi:MAG: cobalt-precorrin-5B (C1)-methyltransferase [Candidatus Endobugula sp.]|jgi:cobalt-precorrin-5B (C1)-methyltransferase
MWKESSEDKQPLRTGLTTGTCATACAVAGAHYLLSASDEGSPPHSRPDSAPYSPQQVSITLPKAKSMGKTVELTIEQYHRCLSTQGKPCVTTSTVKDAGDDPDATHGATVFVELQLTPTAGITFVAAKGVGTVTRDGLLLAVGEPAINPVPRQMINQHLGDVAKRYDYNGGFMVAVGVENGESIAQKTMNPRLGIMGGLSILGTTGIVRPFSCAAWIASIYQGMDVATANGIDHLVATTGNTSEASIKQYYQDQGTPLSDMALIEMGDFAGAVLKHGKNVAVHKLTLCGGIGKISKLANGHMDLNSRVSAIDFEHLASIAKVLGASAELLQKIVQANTSVEVMNLCQQENISIADRLCEIALQVARKKLPKHIALDIWAIDRKGNFVGYAKESISVDETDRNKKISDETGSTE